VLESRLGRGREAGPPTPAVRDQEAITALRKADAFLEAAQRDSEPILDGVSSQSNDLLDRVASELATSWTSSEETDTSKVVSAAVNCFLTSQVVKLADFLSSARMELSKTLGLAHEAVLGDGDTSESLPTPAGAPVPDLTLLIDRLNLNRPVLLSKLGKRLIRGHIRHQLETEIEIPMTELLSRYRRELRDWFGKSMLELRDSFAARAGIYRAQLEGRESPPGTEATKVDLEADLVVLQNWGRGAPQIMQ